MQIGIRRSDGITVGLRVVQGDGCQLDQDRNFICVGTVEGIDDESGAVVVIWDTGERVEYRSGYEGGGDLRVLDNAPAGSVLSLLFLRFHNVHKLKFLTSRLIFC